MPTAAKDKWEVSISQRLKDMIMLVCREIYLPEMHMHSLDGIQKQTGQVRSL